MQHASFRAEWEPVPFDRSLSGFFRVDSIPKSHVTN
jgi:hypothetical protein